MCLCQHILTKYKIFNIFCVHTRAPTQNWPSKLVIWIFGWRLWSQLTGELKLDPFSFYVLFLILDRFRKDDETSKTTWIQWEIFNINSTTMLYLYTKWIEQHAYNYIIYDNNLLYGTISQFQKRLTITRSVENWL